MIFLGSPVLPGRATDRILQDKIDDLDRAIQWLAFLEAHDVLCLLKNSIVMPKLLYVLRTSPCFDNSLLDIFDDTLRHGLLLKLNVELNDKQWNRMNLLVHMGGLGVRSTGMLATSAFLALAAATLPRQRHSLQVRSWWRASSSEISDACLNEDISECLLRQRTKAHSKSLGQSDDDDAARLRVVASEHQETDSMLRESPQSDYASLT